MREKARHKIWTPERLDLIEEGLSNGLSAREIAKTIGGGFTKNAVIGKIWRIKNGMSTRKFKANTPSLSRQSIQPRSDPYSGPRGNNYPEKKMNEKSVQHAQREPARAEDGSLFTIHNIPFRGKCKFGYGDPSELGFHFCGNETVTKGSGQWCGYHADIAYQPPREPK